MQVWPPHLLLQKTKCRYSPPTYYFNSSRSIYRSPSYDQFFKYQCSSIYCTTIVHVKRDLLQCQKRPTTSFASINVAASIVQHPLANCRLYYSQVTVDPQKSIGYVQRNGNKKVIHRSFVTNSYTNITSGSSFNALGNSGIVHPTAVLICPFVGATTGANSRFGDFQWKSPFDTCLCRHYLLLIFKRV